MDSKGGPRAFRRGHEGRLPVSEPHDGPTPREQHPRQRHSLGAFARGGEALTAKLPAVAVWAKNDGRAKRRLEPRSGRQSVATRTECACWRLVPRDAHREVTMGVAPEVDDEFGRSAAGASRLVEWAFATGAIVPRPTLRHVCKHKRSAPRTRTCGKKSWRPSRARLSVRARPAAPQENSPKLHDSR